MFISLPGLTLSIDEQDYFELVMKTAERGLRDFMQNKPLSVKSVKLNIQMSCFGPYGLCNNMQNLQAMISA